SDLCTPPLCPLADIRFNVTRRERFLRRSNAAACRQQAGAGACGKFPGACFPPGNDGGWGSPGGAGDLARGQGRAWRSAGDRARPHRGGVYVDDAIWEWRGLRWAHLLADDTDDLHRFAAALGIHRTSYQGPPRTSVPHYDLTAYERRRALAHGAIACNREEIVPVVRRVTA